MDASRFQKERFSEIMYAHLEMPNVPMLGRMNYMPETAMQWYDRTYGEGRFRQYGLTRPYFKDQRHVSFGTPPRIPDPPQYDIRPNEFDRPKHDWYYDDFKFAPDWKRNLTDRQRWEMEQY